MQVQWCSWYKIGNCRCESEESILLIKMQVWWRSWYLIGKYCCSSWLLVATVLDGVTNDSSASSK